MQAPSERHLEDWIVNNFELFGDEFDPDWIPEEHQKPSDFENCLLGEGLGEYYQDRRYVGAYFQRLIDRQSRVPTGIIDLIAGRGYMYGLQLGVVELKKGIITYDAIGQCARYLFDLGELFHHVQFKNDAKFYSMPFNSLAEIGAQANKIFGVMVGHGIQDKNIPLVAAHAKIEIVLYDYVQPHYIFNLIEGYEVLPSNGDYFGERYGSLTNSPVARYMQHMIIDSDNKQFREWIKTEKDNDIKRRSPN